MIVSQQACESSSLREFARDKLQKLEAGKIRRDLAETNRKSSARVMRGGREYVSFSCNDYLGLSHHPDVVDAAGRALKLFGAGAGASRLVTGNNPPIMALERRIAVFKGTESAIVFGSGYLANIGVIPALVGRGDLIVMDELSHACMHAGARLSGADIRLFGHNNAAGAARLLKSVAPRKLLLTETVFSMDGDRAPLAELAAVAEDTGAWLMSDDAHGLGLRYETVDVPLQMGTLSKSAGSYGGYLCAQREVVDLMKSRARSLVYSTGLPPASAAAAEMALRIMQAETDRCERPLALAGKFCSMLNLPPPASQIVPLIVGDTALALEMSGALARQGYLVTAIRPPTVPAGTARLRVTFCADHRDADVEGLAKAVAGAGYRT